MAKYYKFYIARTSRKPSALPRGYYKSTLDSVERSLISYVIKVSKRKKRKEKEAPIHRARVHNDIVPVCR